LGATQTQNMVIGSATPESEETWIGYALGRSLPGNAGVVGVATISGQRELHRLVAHLAGDSVHEALDVALDVGRDASGAVVWVMPVDQLAPSSAGLLRAREYLAVVPSDEVPEHETALDSGGWVVNQDASHSRAGGVRGLVTRVVQWMLAHRRPLLFAAGVGVVCVTLVLVALPSTERPQGESSSSVALAEGHAQEASNREEVPPSAESVARAFVASGGVDSLTGGAPVPESAVMVDTLSVVGEMCLERVTVTASAREPKSATLLLQKSGAGWQVRDVFERRD
jgi:hypothetical protein